MQRWIWTVLLLVVTPGLASAQTSNERRWYGNAFFAPGVVTDGDGNGGVTAHVGVGVDRFLSRGFGIGGEMGYLGAAVAPGVGSVLGSVNGAYHFNRADKFVPFVTGGYSLLVGSITENALNFGAGFNYWFREGLGFRMELRDHVATPGHALGLRMGVTFR